MVGASLALRACGVLPRVTIVVGLLLVIARDAHAQELEPMLGERALNEDELRWEDWQRFHPAEYAIGRPSRVFIGA